MCAGSGQTHNKYVVHSVFASGCPRCAGTGREPAERRMHPGLLIRSRTGHTWAVYGDYPGDLAKPAAPGERAWGIHRFTPSRTGDRRYVWQIRVIPERTLLARWYDAGFGDAWDHEAMNTPSLPEG
jgi:hypothetical protein